VADATATAAAGGGLPPPTPLDTSPLGAAQPLHVSLSRTLPVRGAQRADFLRALEGAVASAAAAAAGSRARLAGLRVVANEDGSRTFLAARLAAGAGQERVRALAGACNAVAGPRGWGALDAGEGRAHVSLAWWLGGAASGLDGALLDGAWARVVGAAGLEVPVERVAVRMGNEVFAVELDGRRERGRGGAVLCAR